MAKLDEKFFGETAKAGNWKEVAGAVIKITADRENDIKIPTYDEEGAYEEGADELVSTSFNLELTCTKEQLVAKVLKGNQDKFLQALGVPKGNLKLKEEDGGIKVTIEESIEGDGGDIKVTIEEE